MDDLTQMWDALARYQPYADKDGHGESWRRMCEQRTKAASWDATHAAEDAAADAAGMWKSGGYAAAWAASMTAVWSDLAFERVEQAIKKRNYD